MSLLLQENHQRPDFLGILSFTSRSIVLYGEKKDNKYIPPVVIIFL